MIYEDAATLIEQINYKNGWAFGLVQHKDKSDNANLFVTGSFTSPVTQGDATESRTTELHDLESYDEQRLYDEAFQLAMLLEVDIAKLWFRRGHVRIPVTDDTLELVDE